MIRDIIKGIMAKLKKDSLYRNSFFIMLSTLVMTGFGFFFWTINARLFTAEQVGLATTLIASMSLLVSFAGLGFGQSLIRFLPTSKDKNRKINTCFTINFLVSIVIATIFLQGINIFAPKLSFLTKNLYFSIAFMFIVAFQSLFGLIDSVFTAYRENHFTVIKNSIFSALKLVFPFLLVSLGAFGIFASWGIAGFIGLIAGIILLIRKKQYSFQPAIYDDILKRIGKFSFGNYLSGFISTAPTLLLPLMITNLLEPKITAYYYVAMMIAGLLFTIPQSVSTSLFAEGSARNNEKALDKNIRKSFKFIFLFLIPAVIITIIIGRHLLGWFGEQYTSATSLLEILALSSIIIAVKSVYMSVLNVKKKIGKMILINLIISASIIISTYLAVRNGLGGLSLTSVGWAWLSSQLIILPFAFWMIIRNLLHPLKNLKEKFLPKNKGFRQFLVKSVFLVLFLILLQFLSNPFVQGIKIPIQFNTIQFTVLGAVLMFSALIFFFLSKDKLNKFNESKFCLKDFIIYGLLGLVFYALFFYSKFWISTNLDLATKNFILLFAGRHLILILCLISFALAVFGAKYIKQFSKEFKKEIIITALTVIVFVIFSLAMQNTWQFLSFSITKIIYFLLSLTFDNVKMANNNSISVNSFSVNIGKVCSGVESILLFTTLYLFIFFLDFKKINKKRMILIFIPGILGTILVNTIRIYLIMLVGILYSPKLAVGIFHTNAGWLFFIIYFMIFWYFAYPWVKRKA